MFKRVIATATVAIGLMALTKLAMAQNSSDPPFRPFNGFFANMFDDDNQPQPAAHRVSNNYTYNAPSATGQMPSATMTRTPTRAPQLDAPPPSTPPSGGTETYDPTVLAPPAASALPPKPVTGTNYAFHYDDASSTNGPALGPPPTPGPAAGSATVTPSTRPAGQTGVPLHTRLQSYRQSPFDETAQTAPSGPTLPPSTTTPPSTAPAEPAAPRPAETPAMAQREPTLATPPADVPRDPQLDAPPQQPTVAKPANDAVVAGPGPQISNPQVSSPQVSSPQGPGTQPPAAADHGSLVPAASAAHDSSVLNERKGPLLTVETIGPRKIVVGKEAVYEVLLQNSGDVAAAEVTVTVSLPDWAEVAGTSASTGEVRPIEKDHNDPCRWALGRIEAHSREKLALRIIPRQSKPFELAVRWDFKQAPSQTMIEVQAPKLTMQLDGPREVFFGKREVYKLKVGNSGNGPAENVTLTLMPLNGGKSRPITHRLGTINAGDERVIEVELTARQAGNVTVRVEVNGDGGAHADVAEQVVVHRPALQVDAKGPAVQFVGAPAYYKVCLRNSGDAPARNVRLTTNLPTGVKFISGSDRATPAGPQYSGEAADGGKVRWTFDVLEPGEQRVLELRCTLALSGINRLEFAATADDDTMAAAESITRVEAIADLRLDVQDPEGPVAVGATATYELHLRNRGTKAAENVEVLAYFSNGVEPVSAEGQTHRISPGQVVFELIPAIPPATEVVLKVRAKAEVAGNHVFRAEVHCKAMGTRLVREETTRYYQENPNLQQAAKLATSPSSPDEPKTAERQAPLPLPSSSGQPLPTPPIKR